MKIDQLVAALGLKAHPEGGLYREVYRSPCRVAVSNRGVERAAVTSIYFALRSGEFSAFHRVKSCEIWHHYDGDPMELHILASDGGYEVVMLGRDYSAGQCPQAVVPPNSLQAARPMGRYGTLCGCTVAPGFEFDDFDMPSRAELTRLFPDRKAVILALTREV